MEYTYVAAKFNANVMKLPQRIAVCPQCKTRFDVDSDVLVFLGLGVLLGFLLALVLCH